MVLTSQIPLKIAMMLQFCSKKVSALVVLSLLVGGSVFAADSDKPPFFKANYQGKEVYLLGSIHIGKADFYPLPLQIEQAFVESDALVIEADVTRANVQQLLQEYGFAKTKQPDIARLYPVFCGQNQTMCDGLKPLATWLQANQIGVSRFAALGLTPEAGVDVTFIARDPAKPLLELESVEFQFDLISSFSDKTQAQLLDEAINATDDEMLKLVSAWRSGDHQAIADIMEHQAEDSDELLDKLLWQRNHTMTQRIVDMLAQTDYQKLFVIVGAGHVVGQQALPELLQKSGLSVVDCWEMRCNAY
ncbi:TraB/GumN family protein [uncultured Shewanella sp.]|uniref:TraB/GumN family protein n=1 Tax=uncultured Shewanella sp. TaxID=173975 RepID=UPI0026180719|nr:TraB/GumN family protein [uncultured Shewanella sp.]